MTLKESNVNNPIQVSEANAAWGYKTKKTILAENLPHTEHVEVCKFYDKINVFHFAKCQEF